MGLPAVKWALTEQTLTEQSCPAGSGSVFYERVLTQYDDGRGSVSHLLVLCTADLNHRLGRRMLNLDLLPWRYMLRLFYVML